MNNAPVSSANGSPISPKTIALIGKYHSREIVESLYPSAIVDGPNLRAVELFRRGTAPRGWLVWGNESEVAA